MIRGCFCNQAVPFTGFTTSLYNCHVTAAEISLNLILRGINMFYNSLIDHNCHSCNFIIYIHVISTYKAIIIQSETKIIGLIIDKYELPFFEGQLF